MGLLSRCSEFKLNSYDANAKEANGRKNSHINAQWAVRKGQDEGLPKFWTHPKAEAGKRHDLFNMCHASHLRHTMF